MPVQIASARHDHNDDRDGDRERHERYGDRCFREEHLRIIRGYYGEHRVAPEIMRRYYRTGELPHAPHERRCPVRGLLEPANAAFEFCGSPNRANQTLRPAWRE